ncbi:lantibiotic ABC transporter permease [Papillibacter cinnamivorans]|uniref:TspO and MBR related proteins n=1 Tax=Papillibacter cinnamivorans DSM 12816 TaxID=1122930 RepID=A0A1W2C9A2_9FIRM|nr:lantibiotic ABC transporter permease [Papillibacter cinnamivorans]SMC81825.1 hypothetical protein SAMN02745168_2641 [Papillibacter cinnamivorans DSM 12816]
MKTKSRCPVVTAAAVIAFLAMILVNILANVLPIGGVTTAEAAAEYPNLFSPPGFTFAIWGVIYILLAAHVLYLLGLFRGKGETDEELLCRVGVLFAVSSVLNLLWIFAWHYELVPLSVLLMAGLLAVLLAIMRMLGGKKLTGREALFVKVPFGVYSGWITVAAIANVTALLVWLGWDGFGLSQPVWTVIILALGAVIGAVAAVRFRCVAYLLVFVWAYAGILANHLMASGFAGEYPMVIIAAAASLVLLFASGVYILMGGRKKRGKR